MSTIFIKILNMSLIASVVAVGVMLVRIPLKKAPKLFSYLLWGLVLFKLVCPLTVESVRALIPVKSEPIPQTIVTAQIPQIDSGIRTVDSAINEILSAAPATPAASANPMQIILDITAWVWAAGAAALFAYAWISYLLMKNRMKTAVKSDGAFESDRISTAFVLGFFPPKIHLPAHLSPKEREYILLHEQTHIKHLDHLVKPIAYAAACLHWFNPLVWLSFKLAMQDMELTCDESVLRHSGSDIRADYSRSLLSLSQKRSGLLSPLAFSETGVKPRIKNALHYKKPAFWITLTSIVLITAAAVIFLPNAGSTPATSEPAKDDIPASATVYELHMSSPDYAYINAIAANNDILTEEMYKLIQLQEFSGQLAGRFYYDSDLRNQFSSYDDDYFKDKCLFALIVRSTADKTCIYNGIDLGVPVQSTAQSESRTANPHTPVVVSLTLADNGSGWVESNSWWLVLIELGPDTSGRAPTDYKLGSVFSGIESEALTQQYKTVMYYTEDGEDLVDRYLIRRSASGDSELCTGSGKHLLKGSGFLPLPHVIGVFEDGGWRLYDKTTLKPVSDTLYNEISCQQYPDGYYDPNHLLVRSGSLWALLDGSGNRLTDAIYGKIYLNTYEEVWPIISVVRNGKFGAIGYDGKVIIPPEYTYIAMDVYTDINKVYVLKGDQWGVITLDKNLNASKPDWSAPIPNEIHRSYDSYMPNGYSMTDAQIQVSELFTNDTGFKILGSESGQISDQQMAIYASMHMQNYSYETGNTRAEYDALTMKYFGKKLTDYTGGSMFEFIPGTDRIRAVGFSYDSGMYALLRSLTQSNGSYTGQFYCVNISDSYWDDSPYDFAAVKRMLYNGEWGPLLQPGLSIELREVVFSLAQEADGVNYPVYKSVKLLQTDLTAPISEQ